MNIFAIPLVGEVRISNQNEMNIAARTKELILTRADAFGRSVDHGHVTGSAVIINTTGTALLMTHHAKLDRWLQLGGHCDGIRDPFFVALKEGYEESGLRRLEAVSSEILDLDIHLIPRNAKEKEHLHYDIRYLFKAKESEDLQVSSESKQLAWVPFDKLEDRTDDISILRLRDKVSHFV